MVDLHYQNSQMPLLISLSLLLSACSSSTGLDNTTQKSLCSDTPGTICTWAGTGDAGFNGDGHTLLASTLYWPVDLAFTHSNTPYILDWNNHRVRRVTADNTLTTAIGTDFIGDGPYDESDQSLPGTPGGEVHLNHPTHILPLNDGTLPGTTTNCGSTTHAQTACTSSPAPVRVSPATAGRPATRCSANRHKRP